MPEQINEIEEEPKAGPPTPPLSLLSPPPPPGNDFSGAIGGWVKKSNPEKFSVRRRKIHGNKERFALSALDMDPNKYFRYSCAWHMATILIEDAGRSS